MKESMMLALALALAAPGGAAAQGRPAGEPQQHRITTQLTTPAEAEPLFSLEEILPQALARNRDVLAAQKRYEAAQARPTQEATLPDPMVSLGYRNVGNPLPFTAIGDDPGAYAAVSVAQELPFPGKLRLRGEMARHEAGAAFQEYLNTELQVVSRVKQAYYQLHFVYQALDTLEKNRDLLRRFAQIAETRYVVGQAQQQDVLKAQVELSLILNRERRLLQEREALKAELNALLDRPATMPLGRPAGYQKAELRATVEELIERAGVHSPLLRREQAVVERGQAGVDLARREYYPDFGVMGGYMNAGRFPSMYEFRFDVRVPVFFWRKQRAAVQEQAANVSAARHQYQAAERMLDFGVKDAYLAAEAADELIRLYSGGILPQATLALEASLSSYQVGAVDFLTLINNFRTVLDYELNYYEEVAAFQRALARLEELTGMGLT
jgi:outer membrane protein, heavy metal efflux system